MIKRTLATSIEQLAEKYPVLAVTGPRQSGKTSLARVLFPEYTYHNLEDREARQLAEADPKAFLRLGSGDRMILDEIQHVPDLLSYLQVEVDEHEIEGQFIVTGLQNFALSEQISQSLAGRVGMFTLLPLSYREIAQSDYALEVTDASTYEIMLRGMYPRRLKQGIDPTTFYQDYLKTYVERDLREIRNIGDLKVFQNFLHLLAGRVGQLVNFSSMANEVGVSHNTIRSWMSILEASYVVFTLQPYYRNFGKRVVKSPKVFFYDVGLLCYLLKIREPAQIPQHFAAGQIFENFVILERLKQIEHSRGHEDLYFWRDSNGNELDMVVDKGMELEGVEIKSSRTFHPDMLRGLEIWHDLVEQKESPTALVYDGSASQEVQGHQLYPWREFLLQ